MVLDEELRHRSLINQLSQTYYIPNNFSRYCPSWALKTIARSNGELRSTYWLPTLAQVAAIPTDNRVSLKKLSLKIPALDATMAANVLVRRHFITMNKIIPIIGPAPTVWIYNVMMVMDALMTPQQGGIHRVRDELIPEIFKLEDQQIDIGAECQNLISNYNTAVDMIAGNPNHGVVMNDANGYLPQALNIQGVGPLQRFENRGGISANLLKQGVKFKRDIDRLFVTFYKWISKQRVARQNTGIRLLLLRTTFLFNICAAGMRLPLEEVTPFLGRLIGNLNAHGFEDLQLFRSMTLQVPALGHRFAAKSPQTMVRAIIEELNGADFRPVDIPQVEGISEPFAAELYAQVPRTTASLNSRRAENVRALAAMIDNVDHQLPGAFDLMQGVAAPQVIGRQNENVGQLIFDLPEQLEAVFRVHNQIIEEDDQRYDIENYDMLLFPFQNPAGDLVPAGFENLDYVPGFQLRPDLDIEPLNLNNLRVPYNREDDQLNRAPDGDEERFFRPGNLNAFDRLAHQNAALRVPAAPVNANQQNQGNNAGVQAGAQQNQGNNGGPQAGAQQNQGNNGGPQAGAQQNQGNNGGLQAGAQQNQGNNGRPQAGAPQNQGNNGGPQAGAQQNVEANGNVQGGIQLAPRNNQFNQGVNAIENELNNEGRGNMGDGALQANNQIDANDAGQQNRQGVDQQRPPGRPRRFIQPVNNVRDAAPRPPAPWQPGQGAGSQRGERIEEEGMNDGSGDDSRFEFSNISEIPGRSGNASLLEIEPIQQVGPDGLFVQMAPAQVLAPEFNILDPAPQYNAERQLIAVRENRRYSKTTGQTFLTIDELVGARRRLDFVRMATTRSMEDVRAMLRMEAEVMRSISGQVGLKNFTPPSREQVENFYDILMRGNPDSTLIEMIISMIGDTAFVNFRAGFTSTQQRGFLAVGDQIPDAGQFQLTPVQDFINQNSDKLQSIQISNVETADLICLAANKNTNESDEDFIQYSNLTAAYVMQDSISGGNRADMADFCVATKRLMVVTNQSRMSSVAINRLNYFATLAHAIGLLLITEGIELVNGVVFFLMFQSVRNLILLLDEFATDTCASFHIRPLDLFIAICTIRNRRVIDTVIERAVISNYNGAAQARDATMRLRALTPELMQARYEAFYNAVYAGNQRTELCNIVEVFSNETNCASAAVMRTPPLIGIMAVCTDLLETGISAIFVGNQSQPINLGRNIPPAQRPKIFCSQQVLQRACQSNSGVIRQDVFVGTAGQVELFSN
jgi:hypothetical protein